MSWVFCSFLSQVYELELLSRVITGAYLSMFDTLMKHDIH